MPAPLRTLLTWLLGPMLAMLLATGVAAANAQTPFKPVPQLDARVTDQVGMLTPEQRQRLDAALADYERQTGSQIAVLLVASTEPEAIEQYSIRVTDAWKLGRKGVDDGVLLLVARDNPPALRRLRIEAGRGVQGVLTDAQSKRILQDVIAPHFRQNDYYGGLVAGVGAIEALLNQEKFPEPANQGQAQGQTGPSSADDGGASVIGSIFMIVVGLLILRSVFRPHRPRFGGPRDGWASGAAGFVLGNILANAGRNDDRWRGGGFSGSGGGFSDGGGFSGGGGSFDGGGASGDW